MYAFEIICIKLNFSLGSGLGSLYGNSALGGLGGLNSLSGLYGSAGLGGLGSAGLGGLG